MPGTHPSIFTVNYNNVKGFLIIQDKQAILVDTGYAGMSDRVGNILESQGLEWQSLKLILLTHSHFDHSGGAGEIKKLSGAKLIVHRKEANLLRQGRTPIPSGTRWKGKLISWFGRTFYRKVEKYAPVNPDIVIDEEFALSPYGFSGFVFHTPGHTTGSCSLVLESGYAFVGDLMMGISKKEHFPPFAVSKEDVLNSWARLLETPSDWYYPAHGQRIRRDEIEKELPGARKKYGTPRAAQENHSAPA